MRKTDVVTQSELQSVLNLNTEANRAALHIRRRIERGARIAPGTLTAELLFTDESADEIDPKSSSLCNAKAGLDISRARTVPAEQSVTN